MIEIFVIFFVIVILSRSYNFGPAMLVLYFYFVSYSLYVIVADFNIYKSDIYRTLNNFEGASISYSAMPLAEVPSIFSDVRIVFYLIFFLTAAIVVSSGKKSRQNFGSDGVQKPSFEPVVKLGLPSKTLLVIVAFLTTFMTIWHFLSVDWSQLVYFTDYQTLKHPEGLGLTNFALRAFHIFVKSGGPAFFALGVALIMARQRTIGWWFVIISLYPFFFNLITSSRYTLAYAAVLLLVSISNKKYLLSVLSLFGMLSLFNLSIVGRGMTEKGLSTYDLDYLVAVVQGVPSAAVGMIFNVFDVLIGFGVAAAQSPQYDEAYKMLSFSLLPSAIDGFDDLAPYAPRVNLYVPYSSFAESYQFGILYFFLFCLFYFGLLFLSQSYYNYSSRRVGIVIVIWMFVLNQLVAQYPVRNTFRFIFISIVVFGILSHFSRRRVRGGSLSRVSGVV